jgi:molybdopterin-biosynthesis enzyme MoeA-like protein
VRSEIILVGDELLDDQLGVQPDYLGELVDELVSDMVGRGHSLGRLTVASDAPGELEPILIDAARRGVDLVVTVGGLGPTHDDRVREEVARALGQGPAEPHPDAMEWLIESYESRDIPVPQRGGGWERMGHCPLGARPLKNPVGMACGLALTLGNATEVRCLPGVTYEALPMWKEEVLPNLVTDERTVADIAEATVLVRGVREGLVAPVVEALMEERDDIRAGVYLMDLVDGSFRAIRVTLRGPAEAVGSALPELEQALSKIDGAVVEGPAGGGADG